MFSIGPALSYTPDLFGQNRRLVEQASALAENQSYQLASAYLTLTDRLKGIARSFSGSVCGGARKPVQVLDGQRLYAQALQGYVHAKGQRYLDTVLLFEAMGGDSQSWVEFNASSQP